MLNAVPVNLKPQKIDFYNHLLNISWPDNHETSINLLELENFQKPRKPEKYSGPMILFQNIMIGMCSFMIPILQ